MTPLLANIYFIFIISKLPLKVKSAVIVDRFDHNQVVSVDNHARNFSFVSFRPDMHKAIFGAKRPCVDFPKIFIQLRVSARIRVRSVYNFELHYFFDFPSFIRVPSESLYPVLLSNLIAGYDAIFVEAIGCICSLTMYVSSPIKCLEPRGYFSISSSILNAYSFIIIYCLSLSFGVNGHLTRSVVS